MPACLRQQTLPLAKLGALLVRTLAKPVVNTIKRQTAQHPAFSRFCVAAGRCVPAVGV